MWSKSFLSPHSLLQIRKTPELLTRAFLIARKKNGLIVFQNLQIIIFFDWFPNNSIDNPRN